MQRCLSPRSNHAAPTLFFSYFLLPNPVLTGQWTRPAWTCILYSDNSQKAGAGAALSTHPCENFGGKLQPPNTIELFYREYIAACKPGRAEKGFPMFILLLGEGEVGENCKTVAFLITKDRQEGKHSNSTWISQPWWSFSWAWKGQSSWGAVTAGAEGKPDSHGIPWLLRQWVPGMCAPAYAAQSRLEELQAKDGQVKKEIFFFVYSL